MIKNMNHSDKNLKSTLVLNKACTYFKDKGVNNRCSRFWKFLYHVLVRETLKLTTLIPKRFHCTISLKYSHSLLFPSPKLRINKGARRVSVNVCHIPYSDRLEKFTIPLFVYWCLFPTQMSLAPCLCIDGTDYTGGSFHSRVDEDESVTHFSVSV